MMKEQGLPADWRQNITEVIADYRLELISKGEQSGIKKVIPCERMILNIAFPTSFENAMNRSIFMLTIAQASRMVWMNFADDARLTFELDEPHFNAELMITVTDVSDELKQRREHCRSALLAMLQACPATFPRPLTRLFVQRIWEDTREDGECWPPHAIGAKEKFVIHNIRFF